MPECSRTDCHNRARWKPVILLYAAARFGLHTPARAEPEDIIVCDVHKNSVTLADFLSNEDWWRLGAEFTKLGRQAPDPTRSKLTWELLG